MLEDIRLKGPDDCALIVIDVQTRMLRALPPEVTRRNLHNMRLTIEAARELEVPVIVTEHYVKGLGPTHADLDVVLGDAPRLEKIIFSCSGAPGFEDAVAKTGRRTMVLIGTETHVCVAQTAFDLLAEGHPVQVPADAVISRFKADWRGGLDIMRQAGSVITRTETLVFQWLQRAGTDAFRKLAPLIKGREG